MCAKTMSVRFRAIIDTVSPTDNCDTRLATADNEVAPIATYYPCEKHIGVYWKCWASASSTDGARHQDIRKEKFALWLSSPTTFSDTLGHPSPAWKPSWRYDRETLIQTRCTNTIHSAHDMLQYINPIGVATGCPRPGMNNL